jgi:hypothetical protein|tara:strand:+ start:266 stop:415 length:150 start_codon:yes stop_codon:yes gene_type:complete
MIGSKMVWGCDLVEVCSVVIKEMVNVKMLHPNDNGKIVAVNVNQLEEII